MYVCICSGTTDHDVRQAAAGGCRSLAELTMRTGCAAICGSCAEYAAKLLIEARSEIEFPLPIVGTDFAAAA